MDLSKNGINAVGGLVTAALVLGVGFFVAKPQYSAASDFTRDRTEVVSSKTAQEVKLANLKKQEKDLPALKASLNDVQVQIPDHEDIGSVGRVIVEALAAPGLKPGDVTLKSFSHLPPIVHAAEPEPLVGLTEVEEPFEVPNAPAPGTKAPEPSGPPVLQTIPLTLEVEGKSQDAIAAYLDGLASGERLILVQQVQVVEQSGTDANFFIATIYGYAFMNAPSATPPVPEAETAE